MGKPGHRYRGEGGITSMISITPRGDSQWVGLVKAVPVGNWVITAKVFFGGDFIADSYAGLFVIPAADGIIQALGIGKDGANTPTVVRAEKWNNWTTYGSEPRKITYGATIVYLRMAWDGTNITVSFSSDGVAYAKMVAAYAPGFAPGRFGICCRGNATIIF